MTRTMLRDSRPARLTALLLGLLAASPAHAQVVEYYHTDAIGNVRAITDASGSVIERHDYQPYGEEWLPQGGTQPLRFTGKERDAETGLDYFGARYYGSKIGRFTTVDPVLDQKDALLNPQKWNRYAYGRNSPLRYVDPDGRDDRGVMERDFSAARAPGRASRVVAANTATAASREAIPGLGVRATSRTRRDGPR